MRELGGCSTACCRCRRPRWTDSPRGRRPTTTYCENTSVIRVQPCVVVVSPGRRRRRNETRNPRTRPSLGIGWSVRLVRGKRHPHDTKHVRRSPLSTVVYWRFVFRPGQERGGSPLCKAFRSRLTFPPPVHVQRRRKRFTGTRVSSPCVDDDNSPLKNNRILRQSRRRLRTVAAERHTVSLTRYFGNTVKISAVIRYKENVGIICLPSEWSYS